jgi:hypothetical protein
LKQLAIDQPDSEDRKGKSLAQRTLALASLAHALHDGFTDMIYVLLPLGRQSLRSITLRSQVLFWDQVD